MDSPLSSDSDSSLKKLNNFNVQSRDGQGSKTLLGPYWTLPFFKGKGLFFLDPKGPGPGPTLEPFLFFIFLIFLGWRV